MEMVGAADVPFDEKVNTIALLYLLPDAEWKQFISQHDIAIPAAWLIANGLVSPLPQVERHIDETYEDLLVVCPLTESGRPIIRTQDDD